MNPGSLVFLAVAAVLIIALPRRLAAIPLLLASAYTTRIPVVELGPANLSVLRVLVVLGVLRVLFRGERVSHGLNAVDGWLFTWAFVLIGFSAFHTSDAWTYRMGIVLGELGVYMLCRVFMQDAEDVRRVFRTLCLALLPLGVLLLLEKEAATNFFAVMGAGSEANIRDGHVRATGPFAHAILAGTVGAMCVPMALSLWRTHRVSAILGICSGVAILFASTSSGPVMMLLYVCFGLLMWNAQHFLGWIRWGAVFAVVALQMVMNDPVYFLMARIDITGSSTGYYRAQLIRSSIEHLNEWWAVGTDYTRHWMLTGIHANAIHADIVNHFLAMGVMGGLPLLIIFALILRAAFREVGHALVENTNEPPKHRYLIWTLGSMLFGQVMSFWAISPYDQSVSFLYLILAALAATRRPAVVASKVPVTGLARPHIPDRHAVRALASTRSNRTSIPALARRVQRLGGQG